MSDNKLNIDRTALDSLLLKRFFYAPSFSIYGGVAGLYDFGPTGTALQQNLINMWRQHFIIEEDMLEVDCSIMTPAEVLKTSGHVEKFTDWMCKDVKTGDISRADHLVEAVLEARLDGDALARKMAGLLSVLTLLLLLPRRPAPRRTRRRAAPSVIQLDDELVAEYKNVLAQIDNYDGDALGELITRFEIRNPDTGNEVTKPFLNFSRLLEFNNQKMPFASAMVGRSFRNEISPRQGLLRVREFTMAEVEHYVDPLNKDHPRFDDVADVKLRLLPSSTEPIEMTIGDAVTEGVIDNKTLGYFMGRIYLYLMSVGIKRDLLRFRQHMDNEMAHYACDCWDAEIKNSFGWIECRTNEKLCVRENLPEPRVYEKLVCEPNSKVFGPKLKRAAKPVQEHLEALPGQQRKTTVTLTGTAADGEHEITSEMITIENKTFTEYIREYTPNVIEPSFGIGRIMYSLIEHSYTVRADDEQRAVLSFNPAVAPFKCLVLPLSNHASFEKPLLDVARRLRTNGVPARIDDAASASIGRRYARNDELVTLRERDTTKQIRASIDEVVDLVKNLVLGNTTWDEALSKYPSVNDTADESKCG
ncbi:glycyl-tRNA synthetase 1 [Kickxella alabastrina]|uniref:glycyl-tRNA synthetase 1 n=1 Tax=Kickxella alabastrina TaxID=61397 RepID=UPI0022208EEE|nr:glycyl-tRNA synthetase 1 [Kickxella alabastrina]KAI7833837.1 glycyl-tRNA synthetase 1 [Kickxella alabastrina]